MVVTFACLLAFVFYRCLERKCGTVCDFCKKHKTTLQYIIWGILIASYLALVIAACVLNFHRALPLFVITVVVIFFVVWDHFMAKYESRIDKFLSPGRRLLDSHWFWLKWVTWGSLTLAVLLWLILDTAKLGQRQLVSFGGLVMYTILTFLFSKHPTRTFLAYSDAGASFVFGEKYTDHFFAFKVLPIVVFFSTVMSMLYYLGLMQWLVRKVGWIMLVTMGTSPVESVVASGNIFVGQIICSYIFMPFSFMMGVDWQDSFMVAKLIGYKTFFNEFVAYQHLSELIHLRQEAGPKFVNGVQQYMSIRSETVATYALCGFANIGSLGIVIGGLTSITPSRKRDIASGAVRALIAGTIACFMTACIAGLLRIAESVNIELQLDP
ncbi:Solute carrier family 28 member 3 [Camelus dromedarius]|uniref:Solute carrier family 28 member 3 n=1 Tax=Camelus dromedarius TaxID=9838 RepID=A0A5N4C028_CAMDR|nr:Solute carrier family 28 member 3 [Camelus dromedarius]